jgi:hypothetical protein
MPAATSISSSRSDSPSTIQSCAERAWIIEIEPWLSSTMI